MKKIVLVSLLFLTGCMGDRAIIVMPGTAVVLEKPIKGATVAVPDKEGNPRPGVKVDLPAGALIKVPDSALPRP